MPHRPGRLHEKQTAIRALLVEDPERSNGFVARSTGAHHSTVQKHRERLEAAGAIAVRSSPGLIAQKHGGYLIAPERGNQRNLRSGAQSEVQLAPRRIKAEAWARGRWPWLDAERVGLAAQLVAVVDQAWDGWIEQEGIVSDRRGNEYPVVGRWSREHARLWNLINELDREGKEREAKSGETLESYVAGLDNGSAE